MRLQAQELRVTRAAGGCRPRPGAAASGRPAPRAETASTGLLSGTVRDVINVGGLRSTWTWTDATLVARHGGAAPAGAARGARRHAGLRGHGPARSADNHDAPLLRARPPCCWPRPLFFAAFFLAPLAVVALGQHRGPVGAPPTACWRISTTGT